MSELESITPLIPVPPPFKDEPTGRFRRPVIPAESDDSEEHQQPPPTEPPRKPASDGRIDEYA